MVDRTRELLAGLEAVCSGLRCVGNSKSGNNLWKTGSCLWPDLRTSESLDSGIGKTLFLHERALSSAIGSTEEHDRKLSIA